MDIAGNICNRHLSYPRIRRQDGLQNSEKVMTSAEQGISFWSLTASHAVHAARDFFSPLINLWVFLAEDRGVEESSHKGMQLEQALSRIELLEAEVTAIRSLVRSTTRYVVDAALPESEGLTVSGPFAATTRRRA